MGAALITGASAGLGAEFARQLAAKGLDLVLVARRVEKLNDVKQEIENSCPGISISLIEGDLSQPETPQFIAEQISAQGIELHYLVNNAGASGPRLLQDQDIGWWPHQEYTLQQNFQEDRNVLIWCVASTCIHCTYKLE